MGKGTAVRLYVLPAFLVAMLGLYVPSLTLNFHASDDASDTAFLESNDSGGQIINASFARVSPHPPASDIPSKYVGRVRLGFTEDVSVGLPNEFAPKERNSITIRAPPFS